MTMPWKRWTGLDESDLALFEEWVKWTYPNKWQYLVQQARENPNDPLYTQWKQMGKPTDVPWRKKLETGEAEAPAEAPGGDEKPGGEKPQEGWVRVKDFLGPGRDAMVLYGKGIVADFRDISQDVGQSLPVQARWYLQELERTRRVLGLEQKPSGIEESVRKRLGTQGEIEQLTGQSMPGATMWEPPGVGQTISAKAPGEGAGEITEEDIEVMKRLGEGLVRGKLTELEAIRQRDIEFKRLGAQFESDKAQLLRGLPSGPEGAVARWFVTQMRKPWQIMTGPEREVSPAALGGPPTPSWMPELVPGTKAGQPLGKGMATTSGGQGSGLPFVPTPSGQQLTRMAPSQAQWLSGAINWYGGRPWGDILAQAEQMQPLTPQGAGRRRWSPPSQYRV